MPSRPREMRGQQLILPAGKNHENKGSAGKAGIDSLAFTGDRILEPLVSGVAGGNPRSPRSTDCFEDVRARGAHSLRELSTGPSSIAHAEIATIDISPSGRVWIVQREVYANVVIKGTSGRSAAGGLAARTAGLETRKKKGGRVVTMSIEPMVGIRFRTP
jgi:hypothetical protein